ncbi:XRE family transcriptional regulator [Methylobacterium radiotolerans]|uniref:helix-turn-helix domain-containing protein n=1 Tax=Methylobacterium TaxID=407 RepID=UPI002F330AF7
MFHPERLSLARRRRGLTKKTLAERLGVTPHTVLRYEQSKVEPPPHMIDAIARELKFPSAFFSGPDFDEPQAAAASFRSMSAMSARERGAALAAGALAFMLSDWVEDRFALPEGDLLDLSMETPEGAARSLREKWGLGERPIKSLIKLIESKGVRVFSLAENTKTVDAFSLWRKNKPYIFLNTFKTWEHSRFDAAHELAHLVLHKHGGANGRRDVEDEAQRFASSFLMPSADVEAQLPRIHTLNQMVQFKQRWGVSVAALNYRLHKLNITSDWQYRTFCIQITEKGYREDEPVPMLREKSTVWQKVFDALWQERVTKQSIAEALNLPVQEIENLVFGLANMLTVDGGGGGGQKRANLKLVHGGL